ncbi:MAG: Gfo/Idh/MocA family protein [Hyphomicrobiaceae bacterium]
MVTKLGFIGFGIMGERLLRAAAKHDKSTIVVTGAFDPHPGAIAKLQAIDSSLTVFRSPEDVIASSDCLHIASPPSSHLDYLRRCHAAGKAALCEKPLAIRVDAAQATVEQLRSQRMRAAVNFPFASSFARDYLVQWLNAGIVGKPERVDIELAFADWPRAWQRDAISWLDGREEGGFTREVGSHFLFLSRRFFGPLVLKRATCSFPEPGRSERHMTADLTAGEIPVSIVAGVGNTTIDDQNTWTIVGSHGRVRLRDWSIAEREIDGHWEAPPDAIPNEQARPKILARQLDKIAAMTRGEQTNLAGLGEALEVQTIVEKILTAPID